MGQPACRRTRPAVPADAVEEPIQTHTQCECRKHSHRARSSAASWPVRGGNPANDARITILPTGTGGGFVGGMAGRGWDQPSLRVGLNGAWDQLKCPWTTETAHECTSIVGDVPVMMRCAISDFGCVPPFARAEADKVSISEARRRDESKTKLPSQIVAALRGAPRKAIGSLCPTRDERRRPRCRAGSALEPLIARTSRPTSSSRLRLTASLRKCLHASFQEKTVTDTR